MCGPIESCCEIGCQFRTSIADSTHICSCEKSERFGETFTCGTPMCHYMEERLESGNCEFTYYDN